MLQFAFGIAALIAATAFSPPKSRRSFVVGTALRCAGAALLTVWLLAPTGSAASGWPVVLFAWGSLAWSSFCAAPWPEFVESWRQLTGQPDSIPDRRVMPLLVTAAIEGPAAALAYFGSVWLFMTGFQRLMSTAGLGYGFNPGPIIAGAAATAAVVAGSTIAVFFVGRKRNPWYPAQREYLLAVRSSGEARRAALHGAVRAVPGYVPVARRAAPVPN